MTLKQRVDEHDREMAEIRALQLESQKNLTRLEKSMIGLVNQQAELTRTVDRFIESLRAGNGHRKR